MSVLNISVPYENGDAILLYILMYETFHSSGGRVPKANSSSKGFNDTQTKKKHIAFLLNTAPKCSGGTTNFKNPHKNTFAWLIFFPTHSLTTATVDKTVHNYGSITTGSSHFAEFTITNTGNHPLLINRVSASCGCTNVTWEKQPVESGQTATVRVDMKPDETGYFDKTIDIYSNAKESPVRLRVTGTTIN